MKKLLILLLLGCAVGTANFGPEVEPIPEPVEPKPIVTNDVHEWYMYGKLMSREYKVVMPDGSNLWLKYKDKIAPTIKEVQAKADARWGQIKQAELNKPQICSHCGGTGIEP